MRRAASLLLALAAACRAPAQGPYSPTAEDRPRDTVRAERLSKEAADRIYSNPGRAEELLREALSADLFFGPAHNNLGVVYLGQNKLYEAAHEFEWARKLMPGHPDPRLNLAITLDRAGQEDEALAAYTAALEVWPGHIGAIQGLASLSIRARREEPRLEEWLERVALEGESEAWREWARQWRARGGR